MSKLEPCPFCGSENVECIGGPKPYGYNVQCHDCLVESPYFKVADEAIAAWNRRTPPTSQNIEVLVEELARALATADGENPDERTVRLPSDDYEFVWQLYIELARAILPILHRVRREGIEEARDCQPSTAENPNEDAYQRGRFDGIMEYAKAIGALAEKQP